MEIGKIFAQWTEQGEKKSKEISRNGEINHGSLVISTSVRNISAGKILDLNIKAVNKVRLSNIKISMDINLAGTKVMTNGYQTWTGSGELCGEDKIKRLNPIIFNLLKPYGDYSFFDLPSQKGHLHSWTYTYIKRENNNIELIGSCGEDYGYTMFDIDMNKNSIAIIKDCEGLELSGNLTVMSIYIGEGTQNEVLDNYFSNINHYRKPAEKYTGWTSWYNYYTKISENIILKNLNALSSRNIPLDVFQIDDGYQHAVGDWLDINEKFPSGMKELAYRISSHGYKPGLWLAPFICETKSYLFQKHPDWLLKDEKGRIVKAGWNPGWSGTFYALDFYNAGFREYLKQVFRTVLYDWGYELVKLDFLYAASVIPYKGRSRGQIMTEAMNFIRDAAGDKYILGCGVPLGPSFGRVDYCRIGSDVAEYFEDKKLSFANYRERVSTLNSLFSTIGRWHLNRRAFNNDPDVFMLRENNNKMNSDEKLTLFILNNVLGDLVLFSDDIDEYGSLEMSQLRSMYPKVQPIIKSVNGYNNLYKIELSNDVREYMIYTNLSETETDIDIDGNYYNCDRDILKKGDLVTLRPHETIVLYIMDDSSLPYIIGAKGHILPGSQIKSFKASGNDYKIEFNEHCSDETVVYVGVSYDIESVRVNGEPCTTEFINNQKCVIINKGRW